MKIKTFFIIGICLVFCNMNIAQNLQKVYVNDEFKYSINFPGSWIVSTPKELYHVVRCETPDTTKVKQGSIRIMIQNADGEENLVTIVNRMTNPLKKFIAKDFTENKMDKITINGIEFLLYDCSFNYKKADLPERQRNINCYYLINNKLYCVMFWGNEQFYEQNKDLILKSIESFQLKN
jgi:hypothetical protein